MSQTRGQQQQPRKWQLIGMSQWCCSALCGYPLIALTENWTHGVASRHTIAPISHTRLSPRNSQYLSYYSFPIPLSVGGWVGLSTQQVSNLLKVACSGPGVSRTRNLSVTSPILYHWTTAPTILLLPFSRTYFLAGCICLKHLLVLRLSYSYREHMNVHVWVTW